jgi:formylglycine-generating enzyme required for sulfatase activity
MFFRRKKALSPSLKANNVHDTSESIWDLVRQLREEDCDRYLYRGQNGIYGPKGDFIRQIPAVFRGCSNSKEARAALERSRLRVAWLFDRLRQNLKLDVDDSEYNWDMAFCALHLGDLDRPRSAPAMLGIAQHYGVPTENLDLTNLDPAAVFATQRWLQIDEALLLPPGSIWSLDKTSEVAFIYRYDKQKLIKLGVPIGDLSSGNAGSRPILQEGRIIAIDFDQDLELFAQGAYEIFPFRTLAAPYTYRRPIQPSPYLNEDQIYGLHFIYTSQLFEGPVSIRDFAVPVFYFSPHPYNADAWQAYWGSRPDPFLVLGKLVERELFQVKDLDRHKSYAISLFDNIYDQYMGHNEDVKADIQWRRDNVNNLPKAPPAPMYHPYLIEERVLIKRTDSFRDTSNVPELVPIQPGRFRMGSEEVPSQMYIDETPARECSVKYTFAVGKYPVTFLEFWKFVEQIKYSYPMRAFMKKAARLYPRRPVVMVSWYEASAYCEWLSRTTGQKYRLLTEIEWEYACRAGTSTSYWWGNHFDPTKTNSSYKKDLLATARIPRSDHEALEQLRFLTEVDKYEPNPWGIFDFHGNTWEWVQDVYNDRRTNPEVMAPKMGNEPYRCNRGGSWMDPPLSLRSATRSWAYPTARDRNIGFRVARNL